MSSFVPAALAWIVHTLVSRDGVRFQRIALPVAGWAQGDPVVVWPGDLRAMPLAEQLKMAYGNGMGSYVEAIALAPVGTQPTEEQWFAAEQRISNRRAADRADFAQRAAQEIDENDITQTTRFAALVD